VGSFPEGLAIEGTNLYVGATFGNRDGTATLSLVDTTSGEVVNALQIEGEPLGMVIGDGSLWVARRGSDQVSQIDLASFTQVGTVNTPGTPHDLAFSAGELWVAAIGTLYRVDPATQAAVPVGEFDFLSGLVVTDDRVYVSYGKDPDPDPAAEPLPPDTTPGTVAAIDAVSGAVVAEVAVAGDPDVVALGDSGLWVAQRNADTVTRIDPESFEITGEVQVGEAPAAIDIDGDRVWVGNNGGDSVSLVDGPSGTLVATEPVGARPLNVLADASGIWVALSGDNAVVRVDAG
jgi:DNA-binding beta-propeller fold protein YncE